MGDNFSHVNKKGEANMVDVGRKPDQEREANASGKIWLQPETLELIRQHSLKKGDIFPTARIAGIQAAKETSRLIPLCHPLQPTKVSVEFTTGDDGTKVFTTAKCTGKTGVEMEALTAAGVALLTIYDMCKAVDKKMKIGEIELLEKTKK